MTHCSSRKTSGLSAWEFPAFPFLTTIEGIFVVVGWEKQGLNSYMHWATLCLGWVLFCKIQTFSSFKLLEESRQALKNKTERKICFTDCFAWANAAWLTRNADLFLKAVLQFVMSVAKLERHLLFIANEQIL